MDHGGGWLHSRMGKFRFGGNGEADLHTIVEKSERAYD
jgi:hypothetical protein